LGIIAASERSFAPKQERLAIWPRFILPAEPTALLTKAQNRAPQYGMMNVTGAIRKISASFSRTPATPLHQEFYASTLRKPPQALRFSFGDRTAQLVALPLIQAHHSRLGAIDCVRQNPFFFKAVSKRRGCVFAERPRSTTHKFACPPARPSLYPEMFFPPARTPLLTTGSRLDRETPRVAKAMEKAAALLQRSRSGTTMFSGDVQQSISFTASPAGATSSYGLWPTSNPAARRLLSTPILPTPLPVSRSNRPALSARVRAAGKNISRIPKMDGLWHAKLLVVLRWSSAKTATSPF